MTNLDWMLLCGSAGAVALWLIGHKLSSNQDLPNQVITETPTEPSVVHDKFRILDAETLIYELGLNPSINEIKRQLGITDENWLKDGLPLIHNFITLVQRLPASESHHHAGDGGLVKHSLNVAAYALIASTARSWPPGAKTEDIARLSAVWRYGILTAAMLHDIGKVITTFEIPLYKTADDEYPIIWQPDTGHMADGDRKFYKVLFPDTKTAYSVHKGLGWMFFQRIVPKHARSWMSDSDPNLINTLRAYLSGNDETSALADVIRKADMQSVALDLKAGSRQRFATAKRRPFNEIIMDSLIEMLEERGAYFSIATTAGGDLFFKDGVVYMMAKNVPDMVRNFLNAHHPELAKSFPSDNQRIFDTLLEYGHVESNIFDVGRAVSNIVVTFAKNDGEIKTYPFTVLKFRPETLFPKGVLPTEFSGALQEVDAPTKRQFMTSETARDDTDTELAKQITDTENKDIQSDIQSYIPEDYSIPAPPKARSSSVTAISPAQEQASCDNIDHFLNSHNLLSDLDTGETAEIDGTDTKLTEMGQPTIHAKSIPKTKPKPKAKPAAKTQSPVVRATSSQSRSKQLEKLLETKTESNLPEQTTLSSISDTQKDTDNAAGKAVENNDLLDYSQSAQAGLDEILAEQQDLPDKAPRAVTVHQAVKTDEYTQDNAPDAIDALKEQTLLKKADGNRFLNWLATGLADGTISVNENNSPVHFVERGMLLVTPEIFKMYAHGFFNKNNPECPGKKAQDAFLALGINERTRRTGIYSARIDDKHLFTCFLIPEARLHYFINVSRRPANNIDLQITESNFKRR